MIFIHTFGYIYIYYILYIYNICIVYIYNIVYIYIYTLYVYTSIYIYIYIKSNLLDPKFPAQQKHRVMPRRQRGLALVGDVADTGSHVIDQVRHLGPTWGFRHLVMLYIILYIILYISYNII